MRSSPRRGGIVWAKWGLRPVVLVRGPVPGKRWDGCGDQPCPCRAFWLTFLLPRRLSDEQSCIVRGHVWLREYPFQSSGFAQRHPPAPSRSLRPVVGRCLGCTVPSAEASGFACARPLPPCHPAALCRARAPASAVWCLVLVRCDCPVCASSLVSRSLVLAPSGVCTAPALLHCSLGALASACNGFGLRALWLLQICFLEVKPCLGTASVLCACPRGFCSQ